MAYRITLIPGDRTGPELAAAARRVLDATGVPIEWEEQHAGAEVMEKEGTPLPAAVLESIRRNKVALKGPITTPIGTGFRSVNVALRHELDLFACVRPCKSIPGIRSPISMWILWSSGRIRKTFMPGLNIPPARRKPGR